MLLLFYSCALIISNHVRTIKAGWIDVDTPQEKYTTKSFIDGSTYNLVSARKALFCHDEP